MTDIGHIDIDIVIDVGIDIEIWTDLEIEIEIETGIEIEIEIQMEIEVEIGIGIGTDIFKDIDVNIQRNCALFHPIPAYRCKYTSPPCLPSPPPLPPPDIYLYSTHELNGQRSGRWVLCGEASWRVCVLDVGSVSAGHAARDREGKRERGGRGCCSPRPSCGYSRATRRGTSRPLNCRRCQPLRIVRRLFSFKVKRNASLPFKFSPCV